MKCLVTILAVMCAIEIVVTEQRIRHTVNGPVAGMIKTGFSKGSVEGFFGIPFAKPPVGHLRLEDPQLPENWTDVRNATPPVAMCYQSNGNNDFSRFFRLDIQNTNIKKMAVMVNIHGGSRADGSNMMFDGFHLASYAQIVVVVINYRLGTLGFLGTGDPTFRGTYGFLDQVMALKWVQNNIANFNGDPDKITLVGHSSGSSNVGMLMLSPLAKGLFRAAICQSAPLTSTLTLRPVRFSPLEMVRNVSRTLGCNQTSVLGMKECLKTIPLKDIGRGPPEAFPILDPVIYPSLIDNYFMHDHPEVLIKQNKFNIKYAVIGFSSTEADWFVTPDMYGTMKKYNFITSKVDLRDLIMEEYNITNRDDEQRNHILSNIQTDALFKADTVKTANIFLDSNLTVYMYEWNFRANSVVLQPWMIAPHGIDLFYLFGIPFVGHGYFNFTDIDTEMSYLLMETVGNYVKHLVFAPNYKFDDAKEKWTYERVNKTYVRFEVKRKEPAFTAEHDPAPRAVEFWTNIVPEEIRRLEKAQQMNISAEVAQN